MLFRVLEIHIRPNNVRVFHLGLRRTRKEALMVAAAQHRRRIKYKNNVQKSLCCFLESQWQDGKVILWQHKNNSVKDEDWDQDTQKESMRNDLLLVCEC
jgi:hypothetical protein